MIATETEIVNVAVLNRGNVIVKGKGKEESDERGKEAKDWIISKLTKVAKLKLKRNHWTVSTFVLYIFKTSFEIAAFMAILTVDVKLLQSSNGFFTWKSLSRFATLL